ncbi:Abi family protein [Chryseobacterium gallinarum]|uniref:Abi family protein n=1 Tax=Chryseobacterium gallinarum TaxID=1324352 RepID=UPI00202460FA|nr:Abi family protein [Chryseobacterium gallinarum]MCL8538930.1 Abi family protein [Chryseobacterium gallinarum]
MARYSKTPYTCEQHIELLKERGLIITNEERAKKYLESIGYYRLTGYMFHLQNKSNDNKFLPDTNFDRIIELYKFDKALRSIVLEYIERIEVCVRSKISNKYSLEHGFFWYLDEQLYADNNIYETIKGEISSSYEDPKEIFLRAFKRNYDDDFPPSNMALEILTFGKLSRLYSGLNNNDIKREIAKEFNLVSEYLSSWLIYINNVRNICAHHSRLWNKKVTVDRPSIPKKEKYKFNGSIPNIDEFNTTLYGIISIINRLLKSFNPENNFTNKITSLIKEFNIQVELMGFPEDWETNATWHH